MDELIINSKKEKGLYDILNVVEETLSSYELSLEFNFQIEIIIEEIFVNIVKHAYNNEEGLIKFKYEVLEDPLRFHIVFIDDGEMFNPLEYEVPELSDNIDKRHIGQLGIFIVRKYSDEISYNYENNQNCLSITKNMAGSI